MILNRKYNINIRTIVISLINIINQIRIVLLCMIRLKWGRWIHIIKILLGMNCISGRRIIMLIVLEYNKIEIEREGIIWVVIIIQLSEIGWEGCSHIKYEENIRVIRFYYELKWFYLIFIFLNKLI